MAPKKAKGKGKAKPKGKSKKAVKVDYTAIKAVVERHATTQTVVHCNSNGKIDKAICKKNQKLLRALFQVIGAFGFCVQDLEH